MRSEALEIESRSIAVENLIFSLAQALVRDKASVAVDLTSNADGSIGIVLQVAPADLLTMTGQDERALRSLRTILQAAGTKHHQRYSLDVHAAT